MPACKTHSNYELGKIVGERLIEMEPKDVGPYVLLLNMYAMEVVELGEIATTRICAMILLTAINSADLQSLAFAFGRGCAINLCKHGLDLSLGGNFKFLK
ncbi:hypothetical protein FRX31_024198 [Thalictrum thalictroides]|uniref:Pentatricopeptide repeat-containing protein n=1 Tax=Thalictrum thalictroides TaxID=46969 RepID=A0A7J6VM77_THATH|nr:hypothetical protein FRX31_024198 [Thalictrum thalictroides]